MAKTITQDTFDAVVKENMEEFDMSAEDAIADAVQQFEAQGVNLNNIVKDTNMYDGNSAEQGQHPVIIAINSLSENLSKDIPDDAVIKSLCDKIKSECDVDLARRCMAGNNKGYPVLICAWEKCLNNREALKCVLDTLCSLCNGQPDVLNAEGRNLALTLLKDTNIDSCLLLLAIRFVRLTCIKHEGNRQNFVKEELIPVLANILDKKKSEREIVREVCWTLRVLTFDDDMRATFGKSHDHAKIIVTEAGALGKIMEICKDYIGDKYVLGELFSTLGRLAVRNEFCQEIMDLGGLALMLQTLDKNMEHPGITKQVLGVLKAIAGNDTVKVEIVNNNGLELILSAITKHAVNSGISEIGCSAIATVVLRNPAHCKRAMGAGAADILVKVLQLHKNEENTQKQACMAIRNIVARTREYCQAFIDLEVEPLIQRTFQTHKPCQDEAKAALRDLGCQVELKELWKGEGVGIQQ